MNALKTISFIGVSAAIGGLIFGVQGAMIGAAAASLVLVIKAIAERIFERRYATYRQNVVPKKPAIISQASEKKEQGDKKVKFMDQNHGREFKKGDAPVKVHEQSSIIRDTIFGSKERPKPCLGISLW